MRPLIHEISTAHSPESLATQLLTQPGVVLLCSRLFHSPQARYSFVAARPFLAFRSFGSRCELTQPAADNPQCQLDSASAPAPSAITRVLFGDPWRLLESLMARFELLDQTDQPFPLGGCFGYWGYDLKNFVEPKLPRRAPNDLELPDCQVGFYDSLVVFDHRLDKTWLVSTGLDAAGSRDEHRARLRTREWQRLLETEPAPFTSPIPDEPRPPDARASEEAKPQLRSTLSRDEFIQRVKRAQDYIRAGHIYQVNLSHRLAAPWPGLAWNLFERLGEISPAPFSAYLDCGEFQLASSSPELFLRMSGSHIQTRPIKGTRPRSTDATRDAQLAYDLQTSSKENSELVMITDLLRNDLGKVCEFGSVQVPELVRLERFPQVQHLVSTVEGRLRPGTTHLAAFASCFPGGSITGAPKFRAMEIIDELEPTARGPYTGALGYLGFNRESQLSIVIRAAVCRNGTAHFPVGAGIVADSVPDAEYEETLAKARGFLEALRLPRGHALKEVAL